MEMKKWDNEGIFVEVKIVKKVELTQADINYIVCGAIEGGIGYWADVDTTTDAWKDFDNTKEYMSDYATKIILDGGEIVLTLEDGDEFEGRNSVTLNLKKLCEGFKINAEKRHWDCDLDNADVTTYDCIIQYAVFGEIIYG